MHVQWPTLAASEGRRHPAQAKIKPTNKSHSSGSRVAFDETGKKLAAAEACVQGRSNSSHQPEDRGRALRRVNAAILCVREDGDEEQ